MRRAVILAMGLSACDGGGGASTAIDGAPHADAQAADAGDAADSAAPSPPDAAPRDAGEAADAALAPPDAAPPPAARLVINEVDCHGRDWIEVVNLGPGAADLAAWTLTDDPSDRARRYALPAGALAEGGIADFRRQDEDDAGFTFGIGCGDDTITLLGPDGAVADAVDVPPLPADATWGRLPDGTGAFARNAPTRGEPNRPGRVAGARFFDTPGPSLVELRFDEAARQALGENPYGYVPAGVQLTDASGEATGWHDVAVHIKGRLGSLRDLDGKAAFRVDLNRVVAGQTLEGLQALTLNNMVQDASFVHEWATYGLFREAGIPTPRVAYAWVRVNDEDFGLYALIETYDDVYLGEHFPTTAHLYEGLYGQDLEAWHVPELDVEEGDASDRDDFEAVVAALDAGGAGPLRDRTADLIDWDQVLTVMAGEIFTGHWDGYAPTRNNWYMHFDDAGRLRLLPWGADQTWGADIGLHDGQGRLLTACMADDDCRRAYDLKLHDVLLAFDRANLLERVPDLYATLRPHVARDPRKETSLEGADASVQGTLEFMRWRRAQVGDAVACVLENRDDDGDGFVCDRDCAPDDPAIFPGAPEICGDDVDQDCNGRADDALDCPDCREHFLGPHRYLVCPNPRTFAEAAAHCAANGSAPVRVDGPGEDAWLWQRALGTFHQWWWLGATDAAREGRFVWADGTEATYTAWADGQPDDANGEDCVHYFEWGPVWNDLPCEERLGVLCEDVCAPGQDDDGDGALRCGEDCDDGDPAVGPDASEVCGDGIDQDCDGEADDGPACDCVEHTRGGRRYLFCRRERTWEEALDECRAVGLDLAVAGDAIENDWLARRSQEVARGAWWIGANDRDEEGAFVGPDGRPLRFTAWAEGEPNDWGGDEDCAELLADGDNVWNDLSCRDRRPTICAE